jgi:hypothetical protein
MPTPTVEKYQGPAEIWLNSRAIYEAQSISWSVKGNNNKVFTMRKELAGKSNGPRESEATIKNAIPVKGLEFNLVQKVLDGAIVSLVFKVGTMRVQVNGWFEETSGEAATDASASITGTFVGGKPQLVGG